MAMPEVQSGLNPQAEAVTYPQPNGSAPAPKPEETNQENSKDKKKKKKKKKSDRAAQQVVETEPRAAKRADGHTDAKVRPSEASGGIPNPTESYLRSAIQTTGRLPSARPILIVMDLNGTILHRPSRSSNRAAFVERPHANRFMQYCLDTFYVAIWSSARPANVKKMVAKLLTPEQVERCLVVWSRDNLGLSKEDYNLRVQCYKRLDSIWNDPKIQASYPGTEGRWDQSNTVLVDDSSEKGRSEPFNILALPEFTNTALERQHVLPQVHDYLNELARQEDVSRYMFKHPFKLDPTYTLLA